MRILTTILLCLMSLTVVAAARSERAAGTHQWPKRQTSSFAKPDGRLFNIDGKTQYFAGRVNTEHWTASVNTWKVPMLGGSAI